MNRAKTLTFMVGGLAVCAAASTVRAAPVTWYFAGDVTYVYVCTDFLGGSVHVGTPFSGQFTFESTTPDARPDDPVQGLYTGAVTSLFGGVGPNPFAADEPLNVLVLNNQPPVLSEYDDYEVSGRVQMLGESPRFFLHVGYNTPAVFPSDALPLTPPPLDPAC